MTAQSPDWILIDGESHALHAKPRLFAPEEPRERPIEGSRRLVYDGPLFVHTSTANYSGYTAWWLLRDGQLYLAALSGLSLAERFPHLAERTDLAPPGAPHLRKVTLADSHRSGDPLPATWISETLAVAWGETRAGGFAGRRTEPSHYRRLTFEAGVLVCDEVVPKERRRPWQRG